MNKRRDIIFLGAGATKALGLPLMDELMELMGKFYREEWGIKSDVNKYNRFYNEYQSNLEKLKMDKQDLSFEAFFTKIEEHRNKKNERGDHETYYNIKEYKDFVGHFADVVSLYFAKRAHDYYHDFEKNTQWNYFSNIAKYTNTFITTNWDLMIEIELIRSNYIPNLGSCYDINLDHEDEYTKLLRKKGLIKNNKIEYDRKDLRLLKLHGSIGWIKGEDSNKAALSKLFRASLGIGAGKTNGEPLLIYPSYNKILDTPFIKEIWESAREKIKTANTIDIVGYGLRDEDKDTKKLLELLNSKDRNKKDIRVISRCSKDKKRWDALFGKDHYEFICKAAEDHYKGKEDQS